MSKILKADKFREKIAVCLSADLRKGMYERKY